MMPAPTWVSGLFGRGGGADDLAEAQRRVAILKAELEAIRAGRKDASAAELRKLERELREAVAETGRLRAAQAPPRPTEARPARGMPELRDLWQPRAGAPISAAAAGREYAAGAPVGAPGALGQAWQRSGGRPPVQQIPAAGSQPFGPSMGGLPGHARGMLSGAMVPGRGGASPVGGRAPVYNPEALRGGAGPAGMSDAELLAQTYAEQRLMSDYQKAQLDLANRQFAARGQMSQYEMAQLGQGQAQMRATAAYRQQQAEQAQAQLKQAWMVAQAELAHAQNVMASQIGTSLSQQQGQMWAQGLPYALPQGTRVAPGFERGGPMSQLYRMSGSQFTPRTGRISPNPPPSFGQTRGWVQQAMGQFGAGG